MKRKFTKLMAALALLVGLTIPMGVWGQSTYTKVTTAPSDWSGTYVIVADESNVIFTGQSGTNNYGGYAAVTISNNSVTGDFTAYEVEIEQSGENYSIKHITSTKYLGLTSDGNNLNFSTQAPADNKYRWILSTNEIVPASYSETRRLQYNSASSGLRFACYKKTQKDAFLYKKEAGSTTTCATPTFSPAAGTYTEAQNVTISCATEGATIYYTTNGDEPTTNSTVYADAISVSSNMTIKAMAAAQDYDNSAVATAAYTIVNIEHAGTEADPYTVADARNAIDANSGTQGVYATGIVSAIPTAWNSQYNNITFNFVDNEGDADFLQAFRCVSTDNADASTVAVGDVVVVFGNLTYHAASGTYEFGQGCQLVSLVHPASTEPSITVTPATLHVEAGQHVVNDELTITFDNIDVVDYESFTIQFYNAEGEGQEMPEWLVLGVTGSNDEGYQVNGYISANESEARSSYFKVHVGETYSNLVTINQAAYVAPTYAELPFAFNNGKDAIEETDGLSQEGLGSDYSTDDTKLKFDGTGDWLLLQFNERPGTLTFKIKGNSFSGGTFKVQTSENGETYVDLAEYTELGDVDTKTFDNLGENVRYIKWIYTNKASGNVGLGTITLGEYVEPQPSITFESYVINVDSDSHLEYLDVTFENFEPTTGYAFTCDANGTFADYSWLVAELDINNSRVRYSVGNNEEEEARTGYFKVKCGDVYSDLVTVNQAAYVPPFEPATYIPATEINPDKRYIIVGFNDGDAYAMGYQKTNNRDAVGISMNGTTALVETSDVYEFIVAEVGDGYTIYDERTPGYLYAASSSSNHLKTEAELDDNGNGVWSIGFTEEPGQFNIVAFNSSNRNVMQFNQGSSLFSCYETASQSPVYLYEKVEDAEYTLEIAGYSDDNVKDGYYLIASPVTVDPASVEGMTTGDFDLYSYDDAEELEWRNYEDTPFNLVPGTGYLYAKKATAETPSYTFNLTGTPYTGTGEIEIGSGWNLVGNPFGVEAEISMDYYYLTPDATELIATTASTNVAATQGVFVYSEEDGDVLFMEAENGTNNGGSKVVMNLSRNRGTVIDRAIVRFGEGEQLPKFQLNQNSTKLYIPQGNKDYAIVRSAAQGEMSVSFRASENGTYTLSIEAENVEMNYLHLIDNMTGMDVDLLQTPNYTFEARTNDYTSRFRLVFSANGTTDNEAETFAYFNGSNWTVNNLGEATLQIVDVTGRTVSSEQINGNATISLNQPAGIYMMRLVNGNGVKVQKVVVK